MAEAASSGGIVVGVDGSEGSRHALQWVVAHRAFLNAPIIPVVAFNLPITADGMSPLGMVGTGDQQGEDAKQSLLETVSAIDEALVESAQVLQPGHVGTSLVETAKDHALLVVGCRGRSAIAETLLGSVGSYCVSHSTVPVAIIPKDAETSRPITNIVVGIDGSENAQAALQWAVDHARPGSTVNAVGVYSLVAFSAIGYQEVLKELKEQCHQSVDSAIAKLDLPADAPKIVAKVLDGDPRNTLRAEGEAADLLVLGARGHQGVAHLILGSVTTSLTHHPTCSTVVVPSA